MLHLNKATQDAQHLLTTSHTLGSLNYIKYSTPKGQKFRVGTLSVESAIADICQCIIINPEKREKRINRVHLIRQIYQSKGYEFSPEVVEMMNQAVSLLVDSSTSTPSDAQFMEKLVSEQNYENNFPNGQLIFKISREYVPPVVKAFHGHCTKEINKYGDVYDIMSKVGLITLARLVSSQTESECERELLSGVQIIFKGGAALGKFLFQKQPWWNTLTIEQQKEIQTSFILGGDNDTSFYFSNVKEVTKRYGLEHVSQQIVQISTKTDTILSMVCEEFCIMNLISNHSQMVVNDSIFTFGGEQFDFQLRQASGFRLTKVDATRMSLTPHQRPWSHVFTTQSRVEFTVCEKTVKFELVRAKLGFTAISQKLRLNTYSELLDISLEYPDSADLFKKAFVSVNL